MMGCDIHLYAEVRVDGKWQRADIEVPSDRNYVAFGKLANVRNGHGFAGIDTGDPVMPIAEPRGLPADTTIRNSEGIDYDEPGYVWLGDHSHSWVGLSELLAIDYNRGVTLRGMVTHEDAQRWRKWKYAPTDWCGAISGPSAKEYEKLQWEVPLMVAAPLLPKIIASVCHLGKPEDVRLVFGFDS